MRRRGRYSATCLGGAPLQRRRHRLRPICMHRKRVNVSSTVLAGQKLGMNEVDDGIWLVAPLPSGFTTGYM